MAVIFALSLPLIVAAGGFGVETTYWSLRKHQLQSAADAAAHGGAMERRTGSSKAAIISVATQLAKDNGYDAATDTIVVHTPPVSGPSAGGEAVEVIIESSAKRFFTRMFITKDIALRARAVAKFNNAADACVLALHASAPRALKIGGNTDVTLKGCSVMANSVSPEAVYSSGSSKLTTQCVISGGGVVMTATLKMEACAEPYKNAPPAADPFKHLPVPASTPCKEAPLTNAGGTLTQGSYCGLNLRGTVKLEPGVYVIDGPVRVNALANVSGTGVTIYFKGTSATFRGNGNSTIDLSAPKTGTYAGMLMFGDRSTSFLSSDFNGSNESNLTGALYFPSQDLTYNGNFSGKGGCLQVVARTVEWLGSSTLVAECKTEGMPKLPALAMVKLSE